LTEQLTQVAAMVDLQAAVVVQVLQEMETLLHQVLLVVLVDLAVAVAVAVQQAAQVAQEYFTFSTREQL